MEEGWVSSMVNRMSMLTVRSWADQKKYIVNYHIVDYK